MSQHNHSPYLAGPGGMIFSALLFGYFGFLLGLKPTSVTGQFVWMFATFMWTLRLSAIGFALSAAVTMAAPVAGNLVYAAVGILSSAAFVVLSIWDLTDNVYALYGLPMLPGWVLLLLFAAWNGYGSWIGLRAVMMVRGQNASNDPYVSGRDSAQAGDALDR